MAVLCPVRWPVVTKGAPEEWYLDQVNMDVNTEHLLFVDSCKYENDFSQIKFPTISLQSMIHVL